MNYSGKSVRNQVSLIMRVADCLSLINMFFFRRKIVNVEGIPNYLYHEIYEICELLFFW